MTGSRALGLPSGMDPEHSHPTTSALSALTWQTPSKGLISHPQLYPSAAITSPASDQNPQIFRHEGLDRHFEYKYLVVE
jgi:hypothetical protein